MKFASIGLRVGCRQPHSTDRSPESASAGFTLLETLTAMLILSIALVSLFDAHGQGLRTAGAAADYARARIIAQGLLAETVSGWSGDLVSKRGNEGRYAWSVDIARERAPWSATTNAGNWRLHRVRVTVIWDQTRQIEIDSLKLGRVND